MKKDPAEKKGQHRQDDTSHEKSDLKQAPPWEEVGRGTRKIPKGAAEILQHYFDAHQIEMAGEYHSFFSSWKDLAGIDLAAHSKPRDIKNEILIVEADHPGWMQMITMKKREILREVRRRFPQIRIKDVRVVLYSGPQRIAEGGMESQSADWSQRTSEDGTNVGAVDGEKTARGPEDDPTQKGKTTGRREETPAALEGKKDSAAEVADREPQSQPKEGAFSEKEPEGSGGESKDSQKKRLEDALRKLGQRLSSLPKNGGK
ncbi:MAG: DUF721 domain-containing protein [Sediminispirochaetaceae bacterium]